VGDVADVVEDVPLVVAAPGVLANDTDPDGDRLVAEVVDQPDHGRLALDPDGGYRYEPVADYAGPDRFTYRAGDGASASGTATVVLTVAPVNDPPRPGPVSVAVATDRPAGVTVDVVAASGDTEGAGLVVAGHGPAAHGTVVCGAVACSYVAAEGYVGPDSFAYTVRDRDGATARGLVTVTVLPAAGAPAVGSAGEPVASSADAPPGVAVPVGAQVPALPVTGAGGGLLASVALALVAAGLGLAALAGGRRRRWCPEPGVGETGRRDVSPDS
jgi:hypothetical protein